MKLRLEKEYALKTVKKMRHERKDNPYSDMVTRPHFSEKTTTGLSKSLVPKQGEVK